MASKALVAATGAICVFASGCAATHKSPAPSIATQSVSAAPVPAAPKPARQKAVDTKAPQPAPRQSAPKPKAAPDSKSPDLATAIKGETSWTDGGKALVVKERSPANAVAVPLFRQAIVLAKVRAALAGSPASPTAEFRHGMLTLTFPRGNNTEIADAANRALSTPEVNQLRIKLPQ